jgi:Polyketide cyclase / dehydrase and lipid transport
MWVQRRALPEMFIAASRLRNAAVRLNEQTRDWQMASVRKEILTDCPADEVWSAIRDIGALHTRLVPGFVIDTKLEPGARIVTFGNGMVIREPIVTLDEAAKRLVWSAEGGVTTHYNAAVEVSTVDGATRVVWIADFLPNSTREMIADAMEAGMAVMKKTLDRLAKERR